MTEQYLQRKINLTNPDNELSSYVDDLNSLRVYETLAPMVLVLEHSKGYGCGGGLFFWDEGFLAPDDNALVIESVIFTNGRWRRLRVNPEVDGVNICWFGARPDGLTDSTSQIQAAIDSQSSGGRVYVPSGSYIAESTIHIDIDGIEIIGDGPSSVISAGPAS